ncbi:hypothetical protein GCM10010172_46210 [Paractinoplanes ferrugineus]|uniref:Uncharacterized protein n=1 Tax=Paractinoplanes ferrugineus TaxID=113564 RepID=A0A919MDJ4_9ACTN|nr:hypothetical protein [Actinoplanes ferrugineus]GIE15856.1 hypothetical protein Afe05nite_76960 [Actinoplanes ferrugineus]
MPTSENLNACIQEVVWAVSRWREATAQVALVRPEVDAAISRAVAAGRALRQRGVQSRIERETGLAHATVHAASREADGRSFEPLSAAQRALLALVLHHPVRYLKTVGHFARAGTLSQARDLSDLVIGLMRMHSVSPADSRFLGRYVDLLPESGEDADVRHAYTVLLAEALPTRGDDAASQLMSAINREAKLGLELPISA